MAGQRTGDCAFLFDLDGTLVDSMPDHLSAWAQLAREYGLTLSDEEVRARIFGVPNETSLRNLFGEQLSRAERDAREARKEALFRESYRPRIRPLLGARDFLTEAHERGIALAIVTGAGAGNIALIVDGLSLRGTFGAIVGAEDTLRGKPHPDPFLLAAERLGMAARRCLVFEDAPAGLDAALSAGMRAVALSTTHGADELGTHPAVARVIADFRAFPVDEALRLLP